MRENEAGRWQQVANTHEHELKTKEMDLFDCRKRITDSDKKLKDQQVFC